MDKLCFTSKDDDAAMRLDKFLADNQSEVTRSGLERLFDSGMILVNGMVKPKNYRLKPGDDIEIRVIQNNYALIPQDLPLDIVYEDEYLIVVNKERGMAVHPSLPEETGTLVNALLNYCNGSLSVIGGELRPGIVHRIDKDTSGLLVAAKSDDVHISLAKQAERHTMLRRYEGVVHGRIKDDEGVIDAPIGRHPVHRTKNCVRKGGRRAVTYYRVLQRFDSFTHVQFTLETGRTHQIRVHMAHIGRPIVGDMIYGVNKNTKLLKGQCLHAKTLGFTHPITNERLKFTSKLPGYFKNLLYRINAEDS